MVDEDQIPEPPEWWRSTLTAAWFETRMEADRTMVALSAGGIGLLVTLLTTVGSRSFCATVFYALALLGFIAGIVFGLVIFKMNGKHIAEAARDPEKADKSPLRPKLRRLDWALMVSFGFGIFFSILVGITAAATLEQWRQANREDPNGRRSEQTTSGERARPSTGGTEELRRLNEPPADTGGQR